jgi:hypothetical protein
VRWAEVSVVLLVLAAIIAGFVFLLRRPMRSTSAIVEKSIAVLPFENRSEDKANAYFADGIQDEILTLLSKIADLKDLAHFDAALQDRAGKPVRDRQTTWRRPHPRRQRAKECRFGASQRAANQSSQRFPSLGRYL